MAPLLEVRNLTVAFDTPSGTVHAVNNVSYNLEEGETLGIVGESGSGKSVHALSIVGLIDKPPGRIVSGEVIFNGRNLLALSQRELLDVRGKEIGFVFQDPMTSLNPVLTIERQIAEPLRRHFAMSSRQARERVIELLDLVGIPDAARRAQQFPHEFSGGMRQRVMIAIGISCNPKLLIADEATTALDVTVQAQIIDLVRNLKRKIGTTVIWITHDMGVVAGLADTVQVMYGGRIMERGPVSSVFHDPRSAYTWGLKQSLPQGKRGTNRLYQIPGNPPDLTQEPVGDPFAPRNPFATDRCRVETPPLRDAVDSGPGHKVAAWYDLREKVTALKEPVAAAPRVVGAQNIQQSSPLISIRSLAKHYGGERRLIGGTTPLLKAVNNVSFDVAAGETLGLVGESGSGKSTTGRALLQLEEPTSGEIIFKGKDISGLSKQRLKPYRRDMQIIFQDPYASLNPRMTVGEFVGEPLQVHDLAGPRSELQDRVASLFRKVGLDPAFMKRYPHQFSGGQRQRVNIARAIALNPAFIVADEPITALDVSIQAQIVNLFQDLQDDLRLTYLFIAHDLSMIRYLCHRVAVMLRGRVVEIGPCEAIFENPQHPYTKSLLSAIPVPDPGIEKSRRPIAFDVNAHLPPDSAELRIVGDKHFVLEA